MPNSPTHPLHTIVSGQGPTLLCLHGHPGAGGSMAVFTEPLRDRFTTLAPDLRGYGRSRVSKPFEIEQHLDDLVALLDRRNSQKALILGWSLGGIFAMELALRYPDRVSGLILVATAARPWSDHPKIRLRDNVLTGAAGLINLIKPGWQWNIDVLGKRSLFRYLVQQHRPEVYQFLAREAVYAYFKTSRQADQALNRAIGKGYNRVPDLAKIQCPSLMLIGNCDRHISPAASRETAKALPNCEWEGFEQTAHLLPWEVPDRINDRIAQWLQAHPEAIPQQ